MSQDKTIEDYKIILLGNEEVGKTVFFKKLLTGEFRDKNIKSIGIDKKNYEFEINIENKKVKKNKNLGFNLYDLTGIEKFRSITVTYIKHSDGIIIMYDLTNRNSFDSIENWINIIKELIPSFDGITKYVIMLIGNKLDLIDDKIKTRQVTEEEAKILCEKHNIIWGGEKSFKNMNKNEIEEMMKEFIKEIYNKIGEKIIKKMKIPSSFKYERRHHHIPKCIFF